MIVHSRVINSSKIIINYYNTINYLFIIITVAVPPTATATNLLLLMIIIIWAIDVAAQEAVKDNKQESSK